MKIAVQAFAEEAAPAGRLAGALGLPFRLVDLHEFPDGESMPVVWPTRDVVLVYRSLDRPNLKLVPLLLACDAWRRSGARRLVLVAPYLCYLRQDAVFRTGQPLSRDVVGRMISGAFDRLVTVDPHLHRTGDLGSLWGLPVTVVSGAPALAAAIGRAPATTVIGPDEESAPWAASIARILRAPSATFRKQRTGDRAVHLQWDRKSPLDGRRVVLVDDVASTGETLAAAARIARSEGAARVDVAVTHGLFGTDAVASLKAAGVQRIVTTDSCVSAPSAAPLADLLAAALHDEIAVRRRPPAAKAL